MLYLMRSPLQTVIGMAQTATSPGFIHQLKISAHQPVTHPVDKSSLSQGIVWMMRTSLSLSTMLNAQFNPTLPLRSSAPQERRLWIQASLLQHSMLVSMELSVSLSTTQMVLAKVTTWTMWTSSKDSSSHLSSWQTMMTRFTLSIYSRDSSRHPLQVTTSSISLVMIAVTLR